MKIISLSALFTMVLLLLLSCVNGRIKGNYLGVSRSMKESKQNGFFLDEYTSEAGSLKFMDSSRSYELRIKEAFVEKKWRSLESGEKISLDEDQMVLVFEELPSEYGFEWIALISPEKRFSNLENSTLIVDLKNEMIFDTLPLYFYIGRISNLKVDMEGVRLDTFNLIKR